MGAFREFFKELWNDYIKTPLDTLADKIDTKIGQPIKGSLDSIYERLTLIKDGVVSIPTKITETNDKLIELKDTLTDIKEWFTATKEGVIDFFSKYVDAANNALISYWIGRLQNARCVTALNDLYDSAPSFIRENPGFMQYRDTKKEELTAEGMLTIKDFALGTVGTGVVKGLKGAAEGAVADMWPAVRTFLKNKGMTDEDLKPIEDLLHTGVFGVEAIVSFLIGVTLYPAVNTSTEPVWELTRQQVYKKLPVRLLPETTILRMMYKGLMSEEEVSEMFAKIGYDESIIKNLKDDYKWIPTIPDVITWAVREAFYEDYAKEYGLDEEYPTEKMNHYGAKWGIMPEELKYFWRAHWFLPSIGQGYEMLQRKVISDDELDTLFTAADIMPWWRPKLKAISYTPLGRVDVRRMVRVGTINTKEECQLRYEQLGYNPENAALMVDFTWKYELEERKALTYSQIMKAYKEMDFPAPDAKDLLMLLGYSVTDAEYLVTYWDYEIAVEAETDEINTIFDLFDAGAIGYDDALDRLNKLDFTAARTNRLLAKLEKKREASVKMLSKEDCGKLLTAGIWTNDYYIEYMTLLNYREEDIADLVKLTAPPKET